MNFLANKRNKFKAWWQRPPTKVDRFVAAFIGGFGMFWVAIFIPALVSMQGPFSFNQVIYWFIGFVISGVILGVIFPKIVTIVLLPFSLLGAGPD